MLNKTGHFTSVLGKANVLIQVNDPYQYILECESSAIKDAMMLLVQLRSVLYRFLRALYVFVTVLLL